jgi:CRISPR-associated protein Cas2
MRNKKQTVRSVSQQTCYIVAYDIPDDRRRTRVHKILLGFGRWTQYSLFECFLTKKEWIMLRSRLAEHLHGERDSVRFYPLCANCLECVETVGGLPPTPDLLYVV